MDASEATVESLTPSTSRHPASGTKIEDLPPRLLGKILSFIPTNDHSTLKEVSPVWAKLIDEHIGVPLYIGRSSEFSLILYTFSPQELISQIGISVLNLVNIHNTILPNFKFPNLVKEIHFIDYISEKNFLQTLNQLTNLRGLAIDMSTCHYLEFYNISLDFLSRLETLTVCHSEYCNEWNEEVHPSKNEVDITLENMFSLLTKNHFRNLKTLLIGFPIVIPIFPNVKFTTSLFHCALNHFETLRHIEVYFDGKLESSTQDTETASRIVEIDYEAMVRVQLHDIFVNLHEFHKERGLLEPWLKVLGMQTSLRRCIFIPRGGDEDECVELPLPEDLLRSSCTNTLVVFKWYLAESVPPEPGLIIDCSIFQNCVVLADINLTSPGNHPSNLINLSCLPLSLQRLCIEGIHCGTDDIDLLTAIYPSLQKLSLTMTGEENGYGMNVDTLRRIYERKTITRLLILEGFNKMSVNLASQNEESSFSFLIMLLKSRLYDGDGYFHMKLCSNGEYAVAP